MSQVEACLQGSEMPLDGATLKQALHQKGINLRYLGQLTKTISQSEHKERLRHIMVRLETHSHTTQRHSKNRIYIR